MLGSAAVKSNIPDSHTVNIVLSPEGMYTSCTFCMRVCTKIDVSDLVLMLRYTDVGA